MSTPLSIVAVPGSVILFGPDVSGEERRIELTPAAAVDLSDRIDSLSLPADVFRTYADPPMEDPGSVALYIPRALPGTTAECGESELFILTASAALQLRVSLKRFAALARALNVPLESTKTT